MVVNRNKLRSLCECEINIINLPSRYRVIPCRTVSGDTLLEGVRCDKMTIEVDGKNYTFDNPIAVIPKTELGDDFDAILNSEILLKTR